MSAEILGAGPGDAGAFGVNYALRPHKFVDRRIFIEVVSRYSSFRSLEEYVYVGLGSFAMEDHKLMHSIIASRVLLSLEVNPDVLVRQKFNAPLASIHPTLYSTDDFVVRKSAIYGEVGVAPDANSIVWFDMTDAATLRVHLDTFGRLLRSSQPGDIVRMTVDIDEKTLGRRSDSETLEEIAKRRFMQLRELLGDELNPRARARQMSTKLGVARLASYAFKLVAERAFEHDRVHVFEPLSLTSYADGHRMLSITGAIVEREKVTECRSRMRLSSVPGSVDGWDELVEIQLPQLTVWEKLTIDRDIGRRGGPVLGQAINFRLHETIPTADLLRAYSHFQRFYPTFRHVLL